MARYLTVDGGTTNTRLTLIEDGKVYNWKGDTRPDPALTKRAPELYFAVRLPQGTASASQELHQQSFELLENFIADKKTAE